ncbi:MAG: DUF6179 domain-containing protein [Huintestinicola sp.]
MNRPDIFHPIDQAKLDQDNYFQSLTEQACICGMLTDADASSLQTGLLMLLHEQTEKWSRGKSTSVPAVKAQEILTSVIYVIGIELKKFNSPEQAAEALKTMPLKQLFDKGMKIIQQKLVIARQRQRHIAGHLLDTPNVYYKSTVIDGISGFFKLYSPQFSAHEIHITADYPVFSGRPEGRGIEFIEQYLSSIEVENDFCLRFSSKDIHHLLCGITEDYRSVPMNLFEPVLYSALGLVLTGHSPDRLDLSEGDIEQLYREFAGKSGEEIKAIIEKAYDNLGRKMDLPMLTRKYVLMCIPRMAVSIYNAAGMGTLDKLFVQPAYPENEPAITFSYGERMDDISYQRLAEKVIRAENGAEKAALILQEVHSLADLMDILSDAELFEEETELLINMLPLPVYAVLLAKYPNDDFLERDSERFVYAALQKRKALLSDGERLQLECGVKAIRSGDNRFQ